MTFRQLLTRLVATFLLVAALLAPASAEAKVRVSFQSFNGSVFFGRYPHAFVVFDGTLDETGEKIHENFGFSAASATPAVLLGPVKQMIYVEKEKWIAKTNHHFAITVDDATYHRMRNEVEIWRNHPGNFYDLDKNNCIHFVGRIAEIGGLKVDYPKDLLRKPRAWLNHIGEINPQLGAKPIKG